MTYIAIFNIFSALAVRQKQKTLFSHKYLAAFLICYLLPSTVDFTIVLSNSNIQKMNNLPKISCLHNNDLTS